MYRAIALLPLAALLACATSTLVQGTDLDWSAAADIAVIAIITTDDDGDVRETKVWFVLLDGVSYLRTNDSRWLENIRRDPNVKIVIDGTEYAQRADEVTGTQLVERVDAATREKYGFQDSLIHFFRISDPEILKLSDPS